MGDVRMMRRQARLSLHADTKTFVLRGEKEQMRTNRGAWGGVATAILVIVAIFRIGGTIFRVADQHAQDSQANSYNATSFAAARADCGKQGGIFIPQGQYYFNATCVVPGTRTGSASAGAGAVTPIPVRTLTAASDGPPATWTASDGTIRLQYPSTWTTKQDSPDPHSLVLLRTPDNATIFGVYHAYYAQTLTIDGELQMAQSDLIKNDPDHTITFDPVRTVMIGGEMGKEMDYHLVPKSDPTSAGTTSSFWVVEHNGNRFVFRGSRLGRQGSVVEAIVASVTFPPTATATPVGSTAIPAGSVAVPSAPSGTSAITTIPAPAGTPAFTVTPTSAGTAVIPVTSTP